MPNDPNFSNWPCATDYEDEYEGTTEEEVSEVVGLNQTWKSCRTMLLNRI